MMHSLYMRTFVFHVEWMPHESALFTKHSGQSPAFSEQKLNVMCQGLVEYRQPISGNRFIR